MRLLADSWKIVLEQKQLVATYVALVTLIGFLKGVGDVSARGILGGDSELLLSFLDIVFRLLVSAAYASIYAVMFARLGREIDKPLWKCPSDRDALQRFFMPWFILVLAFMLLARMRYVAATNGFEEAMLLLELLIMVFFIFIIPLGACIMYWGRFELDEIPEALSPISHQLPLVAVVLFLGLAQYFMGMAVYPALLPEALRENPAAYIPLDIALGVVDCWAFSTMWLVLMLHRDTDYDHDLDF